MMRLLSHDALVEELLDLDNHARPAERTGVPPKAQKLLGEKGQLGLNIEESIIISGGSMHTGGLHVPPKAQKLLGEKARVRNDRSQTSKHATPDSLWQVRMGTYDQASNADSDTVPGGKKGSPLPYVPAALPSNDDAMKSSTTGTTLTGTSTRYPAPQLSTEDLGRDYYDATKQPLYVSQQTSQSSMRDRALRKGAPRLYDSSSNDTAIPKSSPLNSAVNDRCLPARSVSDGPRAPKKIDLRSLIAHGKPYQRTTSGEKTARSPADVADGSDFFPQDTVHMQVARHGSKLFIESNNKRFKPLPKRPNENGAGRGKTSEPDVFDNQKKNVYRLPKGSKYWFDSFDISSEDDEPEPVELPATELHAKQPTAVQEGLPSVFSLYGTPTRDFTAPIRADPVSSANHTSPILRTKDVVKHREERKDSQGSTAADSASSGAMEGRKRSGESRLARSRLGAQSVLSLSSGSDDETRATPSKRGSVGNSTIIESKSASLDLKRPAYPSFQLDQQHPIEWVARDGKLRRANSYGSTSGPPSSNPFRDTQTNYNSTPRIPSRSNGSLLTSSPSTNPHRGTSNGFHRQHRHDVESPRYQPATTESSTYDRDAGESGCDETTSSVPTDASRLMAVTEEEMMLLELMRQKRAAMQKHSFAEGYRLARRQEEKTSRFGSSEHDDHALVVLKRRLGGGGSSSRGQSITSTVIRQELEQRRRLSALRKEDVDRAFKMGRFLEMEQGGAGETNEMTDRFFVIAPGMADDNAGRPMSGTEIETDSRYDDEGDTMGEEFDVEEEYGGERREEQAFEHDGQAMHATEEEEETEEEARTPRLGPTLSPMQRLTSKVYVPQRGDGRGVDEQYAQLRAFLASDQEKPDDAVAAATPLPPSREKKEETKGYQDGRSGIPSSNTPLDIGASFAAETLREMMQQTYTTPTENTTSPPPKSSPRDLQPLSIPAPQSTITTTTTTTQPDRAESPDTPVATTWARPTSLKHPRPQRHQQPVLDFTPLELSPPLQSTMKPRPHSIATSFSSPMSSPFEGGGRGISSPPHSAPSNRTSMEPGMDGATADREPRREVPAPGPDSGTAVGEKMEKYSFPSPVDLPNPLRAHPPGSPLQQNGNVTSRSTDKAPPRIDVKAPTKGQKVVDRVTSMESITSAGEDVLAAWAELGGAGGGEFRRKKGPR